LVRGNALLARTDPERIEQVAAGNLATRLGKSERGMKRVLLVDDYDLFREALALVLKQHTNLDEDVQARSLAEARQILSSRASNHLALAVVNFDLPHEDEFELVGELRRAEIPVLALSASREPEKLAGISDSGADEILTTRISCDELLDAARRLIES
jgi:DNA-binding NarL/FixJ family response regulator